MFGSLAYSHVVDQKHIKLQDKSEAMIFVGYHATCAYKLYDPTKEKMMLSRDVMVLEKESWNWDEMQSSFKRTKVTEFIDSSMFAELEVETTKVNNSFQHIVNQRQQRQRVIPQRFSEFEVYTDA